MGKKVGHGKDFDRLPPRTQARMAEGMGTRYAGTALLDLLRIFASSIFFRIRSDFGVASTYSSGPMYSSTRSRLIRSGGASWMPLPSPVERILLSFFALQGFTGMSSGLEFSPTIIPS